jgi:hypothetical protein
MECLDGEGHQGTLMGFCGRLFEYFADAVTNWTIAQTPLLIIMLIEHDTDSRWLS